MTITLDLPQELEQELSVEAGKISLSLPEYILQLLAVSLRFADFSSANRIHLFSFSMVNYQKYILLKYCD